MALKILFKSNKRFDIIYCHDWQTALVPILLFEVYTHYRILKKIVGYTIHNFKHKSIAGVDDEQLDHIMSSTISIMIIYAITLMIVSSTYKRRYCLL
ncbi:MAG: glycogen/starch synthase [cyanobacterium endosymbiont of Rhopalodia musculus]